MIFIGSLSTRERRSLRQVVRRGPERVARRAQIILLSADGLAVPDIALLLDCCRRTVRHWIHRFRGNGIRGLVDLPDPQARVTPERAENSAIPDEQGAAPEHTVPAIPLTVPEIRRLLNGLLWSVTQPVAFVLHWSHWRRYKQALAMRSHYRRRGADPPPFQQVRL
jgi:Homeodomain-like domain